MKVTSLAHLTNSIAIAALTRRQLNAVLILLAVMMPIAAPIPALAYDLNLPAPIADDSLRFTSSSVTLERLLSTIPATLLNSITAAFVAPTGLKRAAAGKARNSVAALESSVKDFRTEIDNEKPAVVGQVLSLAALPVDKNGTVVNGVAPRWYSSDPSVVRILNDSEAIAIAEGTANLSVFTGKSRKDIVVPVEEASSLPDDIEPLLTEQQAENLVLPENNLGNPSGQTEVSSLTSGAALRTRERHGSSNYSFDIAAASLPGRGIDASVDITYNSRVWNKSGSGTSLVFNFNTDRNWLAPGFEIGYGSIEGYSTTSGYGYLITGRDGTRTQLIHKQTSGGCTVYESTDGSFTQATVCGVYASPTMVVRYSDGSRVTYGSVTQSGKRFPISIQDRNGNFITITYVENDTQGKISSIRDTLSRYITFHYDTAADKKLVAITVPGYDDSPTPRQTIRFYYEQLTLQTAGRFADTAQVNAPTTPINVLRYVRFPGTNTGFRYDYSPYFGTIYKIWQLRGMEASTESLTETGIINADHTIDPPNAAAVTHYNYPATAMETGPPLTDVPKYSWRKDDWLGRTTNIPQTSFFTEEAVTPAGCDTSSGTCTGTRTTTVTAPDGTKNISVSKIRPSNDWENGLLDEIRAATIEGGSERVWSKTKLYWERGTDMPTGRDNPRLEKVETTNDVNQTRATSFGYDSYNNQIVAREHDFETPGTLGTELRRTETEYETGAGWINNRLLRLPTSVKTFANGAEVAKTVYKYDDYSQAPLLNTPGVMQHALSCNPYSGEYQCGVRWVCPGGEIVPNQRQCSDGSTAQAEPIYCPHYDPNTVIAETSQRSSPSLIPPPPKLIRRTRSRI